LKLSRQTGSIARPLCDRRATCFDERFAVHRLQSGLVGVRAAVNTDFLLDADVSTASKDCGQVKSRNAAWLSLELDMLLSR